ncbi:MAG: hypothetical protein KC496_11500 [Anaerolineae bacterium]|nr:hypothetical protein [Anaerolineae bacterium]
MPAARINLIEACLDDERIYSGFYRGYYGATWEMQVSHNQVVGIVQSPGFRRPVWDYTLWRCHIRPESDGRNAGRWWGVVARRVLTSQEIQYFERRAALLAAEQD